ncbi:MAG: DNA-directed RNA polymerase subunit omega [Christensenellales bacterium]|jgi:DNA-directed RNA polymerase subunit omega
MLHPAEKKIMETTDCRYGFVVAVAKRARQLVDNARPLLDNPSSNPVTNAMEEIFEGKISIIDCEE